MPRPTVKIKKKCYQCGKKYEIIQWLETQRIRRGIKKSFCSAECKNSFQSLSHGPNWKGGRKKQSYYTMIWISKGKYIFEHRLVMEKHLGRKLHKNEVIHHINGIGTDNRIENLVLCKSCGTHTRDFHSLKRIKGSIKKGVRNVS